MERLDFPRAVRGTFGALFVSAFATHGAAAGVVHIGAPTVAVDGIFTTMVCGENPCSSPACVSPPTVAVVTSSASWRGQWELLYPPSRYPGVGGGLGALASAEFERDSSGVTFRATLDRTDREILELDLPRGGTGGEYLLYGNVAMNSRSSDRSGAGEPLIYGSSQFRLSSDAFVSISGSLEAWDAVAGQQPFASLVRWEVVPVDRPGEGHQGEIPLSIEMGPRDERVDAVQPAVLLPAGEYRLECSFYTSGAVHGPALEDCPRTVWSDLDVVAVRLEVSEGLPGDLDGNGCVDGGDVAILLLDYGPGSGPADLDGSGEVDGGDIGALLMLFTDCG